MSLSLAETLKLPCGCHTFMKKLLVGFICLLGLVEIGRAQIQLNIDAGVLENALGTAAEPSGGLLQLIASPSGTFSSATTGSYVSGDNVLVASFAMNYSSGTTGETINDLINLTLSSTTQGYSTTNGYTTGVYSLSTGEKVQLRWYPNITYSNTVNYTVGSPTSTTTGGGPTATTYGAVRSDTIEFGPSGGDSAETTWIVPASGAVDLDYDTVSAGGTYANTTAYASNPVSIAGVPEPSTYGIVGGLLMSVMSARVWKRRNVAKSSSVPQVLQQT